MAFQAIFDEIKPDILVTYSPQYGVNGVCAQFCELQNIPVYFIEGSSNVYSKYKALRIWNWKEFGLTNPALKYWSEIAAYTLTPRHYLFTDKHLESLRVAKSHSVYSAPASGRLDSRKYFSIPTDKTLFLAAMSSYDEVFSAVFIDRFPQNKLYSNVFKDQLHWIKETVAYFKDHPDIYLIVRVHPRTFPNKREGVMAANQKELEDILQNLPSNVRVNYPPENISIYDLYPQIDVLITGWSVTGVEAMACGIPVVTYDQNLPSYPKNIHFTGSSQEEYYQNLGKAADFGRNDSISIAGKKWMTFSMAYGVLNHPTRISDMFFVPKGRFSWLLFVAIDKLFFDFIKRIEATFSIQNRKEKVKLNNMFRFCLKSLYERREE